MEERIEYLIQRYLDRAESKAELNELMDLIASEKYRDLIEARFGKDLRDRISESTFAVHDATRPEEESKPRGRSAILAPALQIAAVVSLIATVAIIGLYTTRPNTSPAPNSFMVTTASTSSIIKKVMLDDGSIVWLKGESTLTYPNHFGNSDRPVSLTGEALFEVAKDSSRPFIIDCGGLTTKVLGTSFNIKSDSANTEILVLTGKVSVTPKGDGNTIFVLPNEKITFTPEKAILKTLTEKAEVVASTEHTEYTMAFNDHSMADVARKLESKFNVKIEFSDPAAMKCLITADFTDQSLDATLTMISKSLGFQYTAQNGIITISGAGCD